MKKHLPSFLAGILCAALLGGLTISALAISGKTTIEVYPINVMVNGEVFQPTDAQGHPVDVFTYKGTTYAPLRALAEAYGLEVGYDAEAKLATVTDPSLKTPVKPEDDHWSAEDEAAYQEFKGVWSLMGSRALVEQEGKLYCFDANIDNDTLWDLFANQQKFFKRLIKETVKDASYAEVNFRNNHTGFIIQVYNGKI